MFGKQLNPLFRNSPLNAISILFFSLLHPSPATCSFNIEGVKKGRKKETTKAGAPLVACYSGSGCVHNRPVRKCCRALGQQQLLKVYVSTKR